MFSFVFILVFGFLFLRSGSDLEVSRLDLGFLFCFFLVFRCVLIVMRRTRLGRPSRMGSSSASTAPPCIGVLGFTSASSGDFNFEFWWFDPWFRVLAVQFGDLIFRLGFWFKIYVYLFNFLVIHVFMLYYTPVLQILLQW